jgi:dihydrodipicolinate synthase/N-acetylneuraminate lyase
MEMRGHGNGNVRPPLTELREEHREQLGAVLADLEPAEAR